MILRHHMCKLLLLCCVQVLYKYMQPMSFSTTDLSVVDNAASALMLCVRASACYYALVFHVHSSISTLYCNAICHCIVSARDAETTSSCFLATVTTACVIRTGAAASVERRRHERTYMIRFGKCSRISTSSFSVILL